MKKSFCMIDCATVNPALNCINGLIDRESLQASYHLPSQRGMESLKKGGDADAYIIFGSYSNLGDGSDWHEPLLNFAMNKLQEGHPVLGICFGHQLICHGFGSKISLIKNRENKTLNGHRKTTVTQNCWGLKKGEQFQFFVAHDYEVSQLGESLERAAESEDCLNDVVFHRTLPFLGTQAHPEGTVSFIEDSLDSAPSEKEAQLVMTSGFSFLSRFVKEVEKF